MNRVKTALANRQKGYNCSQAVFSVFADLYNIDKETALKIATGLGGGVGRNGHSCGAVTGAALVLGLKYGGDEENIAEGKRETYKKVSQFIKKFEAQNGNTICNALLGFDIRDAPQRELHIENGKMKLVCDKAVTTAVEILEEMLV